MQKKGRWTHWIWMMGILFLLSLAIGTSVQAASKTVATIGKKNYTSLEEAIKKVGNNGTIVLKKNVTYTSDLTINRSGKKFTLNLNKKKITFKKKAKLNIKKGTVTIKNGTIAHNVKTGTILQVCNGATLNVAGGTYKGSITNEGTLRIAKGTFTSINNKKDLRTMLIMNFGTLTIEKGTFDAGKNSMIINVGKLTINGGTFKDNIPFSDKLEQPELSNGMMISNAAFSPAKITINGGTFKSNTLIIGNGIDTTTIVNGGTFTGKNAGILANNGKMAIHGGTFNMSNGWGVIYNHGDNNGDNQAYLKITGGTFKSQWSVIENYSATSPITISGGTFKSTTEPEGPAMLLSFDGKITVKGGNFTSNKGYLRWTNPNAENASIAIKKATKIKTKYDIKEGDEPC